MTDPAPAKAAEAVASTHPAFLAHMGMLQAIVTRLAGNSASCKTWCLSLVTALIALAGTTRAPGLLPLALMPLLVFGLLDAAYLSQERWFRDRFNALAGKAQAGTYAETDLFAMGSRTWGESCGGFLGALFSWSTAPVYGGLIAAYLLGHDALHAQILKS